MSVSQLQARIKPTAFCLAIDKENSIESLLDFLYYIYNYYVAMLLNSHGLYATCQLTSLPHAVTMTCDFFVYGVTWHDYSVTTVTHFVTLVTITWYLPTLHLSNKEKKRNIK